MSAGTLRQRGGQSAKKSTLVPPASRDEVVEMPKQSSGIISEWDYKLALAVITAVAFVTRFWGIGHPNEVVFDEVHFGKVGNPGWIRPAAPTPRTEETRSQR